MWNKFLHNPFHIVKDYELRKLLWQSGSGTAVCKKYLKFRDTAPEKLTFPETQVDEPIWLFWNTGLEQAPEIVKTCYQSIKKYAGRQVVLLTENNVQNYINMPDYLNEKLKSGVLPLAIYTDLMRVALLEHYGGTWMDATILLTDEIPQEILNSDFFVFHNSLGEIDNPVLYPVWFIHAKQHNRTICEIRNVLFAYWKRNNHVPEYLFSNIVITQIMRSSPEVEKKMSNKGYKEINKVAVDYVNLMTYAMCCLIMVAPEVVKILASKPYWEGIVIIPPVVLSNYIIFVYTMYVNVEHYYKKTVRISLYTAVAAVINLVLNYIFIPYFGYVAAAYTTIVSYVVALILHTSYAKKLRPEIYPIKTFFVALMHISLFTIAFYVLKDQAVMRWALMIVYFFAMLFKERNRIVEFFPQLKRKR